MTARPQEPTPEAESRIAELFSHLQPPDIPAELKDEAFLIGVYEQAATVETAALGTILAATLTPRVVPDEQQWDAVAWSEGPAGRLAVRDQVAAAMPAGPGPAPGVLWTRIRADIEAQRTERREGEASHWMRRAAAAILISASLVGFLRYGTSYFEPDGTPMEDHFVFLEDPGLGSASLDQILGR